MIDIANRKRSEYCCICGLDLDPQARVRLMVDHQIRWTHPDCKVKFLTDKRIL